MISKKKSTIHSRKGGRRRYMEEVSGAGARHVAWLRHNSVDGESRSTFSFFLLILSAIFGGEKKNK